MPNTLYKEKESYKLKSDSEHAKRKRNVVSWLIHKTVSEKQVVENFGKTSKETAM